MNVDRRSFRRVVRIGVFAAAVACVTLAWADAALAVGSLTPWSPVPLTADTSWSVLDAFAFGTRGLAIAGDGGHVAVSHDAGGTWRDVVVPGETATSFTAVAMNASGMGALASGGLLLVTADDGATWTQPVYVGPAPDGAINDLAILGSQAIAVGDGGLIMTSDDAGATWSRADSPTASAVTCVAIAGDGTAVAGAASGEILVDKAGTWSVAGTAAGPVTSVTASRAPTWGDGRPDLVAAAGTDVLGSDDQLTFATLPGLPDAATQPWSTVAWTGVPDGTLLIAGAVHAGFFDTASQQWTSGSSGLSDTAVAAAPADQSVCYLLGTDGRLMRTLSAGRVPATATLKKSTLTAGGSTKLSITANVGAPGTLFVRSRAPGQSWTTLRSVAWTSADWGRSLTVGLTPTLDREYALYFRYGGALVALTDPVSVEVAPKVHTARARYDLRRGDVFRFSGSVAPQLKGERVQLYTDRGGSWRPVTLGSWASLQGGRTWSSRPFGTPKRETYHLRAHIEATSTHLAAWSRVVTVSIR